MATRQKMFVQKKKKKNSEKNPQKSKTKNKNNGCNHRQCVSKSHHLSHLKQITSSLDFRLRRLFSPLSSPIFHWCLFSLSLALTIYHPILLVSMFFLFNLLIPPSFFIVLLFLFSSLSLTSLPHLLFSYRFSLLPPYLFSTLSSNSNSPFLPLSFLPSFFTPIFLLHSFPSFFSLFSSSQPPFLTTFLTLSLFLLLPPFLPSFHLFLYPIFPLSFSSSLSPYLTTSYSFLP